ncbi:LacI family DNA-binding transcriptional regulator [Deinococcus cellulosilyticus]|uniref:DNA-binding transcriptional regulator CytR n=1 Tax=Deinococcus cellulosilyticus (strain DSM 18568 / NBRC 106333 / KACC 11606 / 5516J-15) TaxID=1223518 RepID=A0A511N975_DEIC1|nr:LacI family DNA-binding transcriptional regulator [Deinococcus cellulosilyticus]GEM49097.1 DNA-binding transcriptional regulator CytR [Deinococcus cellulosilyticus NBRC 106333 = KACC 11606]
MTKRATLADIARKVGVSESTVSRALAGSDLISDDTKIRISRVAEQLGYQLPALARAIRGSRTQVVLHLTESPTLDFHARLAQGLHEASLRNNHLLVTHQSFLDHFTEEQYLQILAPLAPAGVVVTPTSSNLPLLRAIAEKYPLITLDRDVEVGLHAVLLDNKQAMRQGIEHLVELGHTRIALLVGKDPMTVGFERRQGYLDSLRALHVPIDPSLMVREDFTEAGGYRAARDLLDHRTEHHFTAMMATNGDMTIGMLRAIRDVGLKVPQDLSVIGFDDSRYHTLMDPPLTVITQPAFEMGEYAANLLFEHLEHPTETSSRVRRMPASLLLRRSTTFLR